MRWTIAEGLSGGYTTMMLHVLREEISIYAQKKGHYPQTLGDIAEWATRENGHQCVDKSGKLAYIPRDPWGNYFRYQATGKTYRVYSVGQNGDIGGIELTGDLDKRPKGQIRNEPTLHEFLYESRFSGLLHFAAVTSCLFAGIVCFLLLRRRGPSQYLSLAVAMTVVATTVAAMVVFFCLLFIPVILRR
jgi:hypothetical protein